MCELFGMSSNRPATVNFSLMRFAEHGGFSGPHRDGWGVAYYEGADVRLIKEAEAASDSEWVRFLAEHDLRSPTVMAHIRRATMGARSYRNTQPFSRELGGRMHLFAHNGWLPAIADLPAYRTRRFQPVGETDSERAFCALLDRMAEIWTGSGEPPPLDRRLAVVVSFSAQLRTLGPANFLYSDGDVLFAHGHRRKQAGSFKVTPPGLVFLQRHCDQPDAQHFVTRGLSVVGADQMITLVASVPLSDDSWTSIGEGEVIAISQGQVVSRQPALI